MSSHYQLHPEHYPWVDSNWDSLLEAQALNALAEQDRMMANCKCEWDEGRRIHSLECPEHDEPEHGDWDRWITTRDRSAAQRRRDSIHALLEGLEKVNHIQRKREFAYQLRETNYEQMCGELLTLARLRVRIEDAILAVAAEKVF